MVGIYKKQMRYAEPYPYHTHGGYRTMITAGGAVRWSHTASSLPLGERAEGASPGR